MRLVGLMNLTKNPGPMGQSGGAYGTDACPQPYVEVSGFHPCRFDRRISGDC